MDLRAKITEALYEPPDPLVAESAFGGIAHSEATRRANRRADAVMGVVEARVRELEDENKGLRAVLENVSCAGTLDEVSDALDKANDI